MVNPLLQNQQTKVNNLQTQYNQRLEEFNKLKAREAELKNQIAAAPKKLKNFYGKQFNSTAQSRKSAGDRLSNLGNALAQEKSKLQEIIDDIERKSASQVTISQDTALQLAKSGLPSEQLREAVGYNQTNFNLVREVESQLSKEEQKRIDELKAAARKEEADKDKSRSVVVTEQAERLGERAAEVQRQEEVKVEKAVSKLQTILAGENLAPTPIEIINPLTGQVTKQNITTSQDAQIKVKLAEIEKAKNLTPIQKENKKREVVGLPKGLIVAPVVKKSEPVVQKQTQNVMRASGITPTNQKVKSWLQVRSLNDIDELYEYWEAQRKAAIRGDKNAQAAVLGVMNLPAAAAASVKDAALGIIALVSDPVDSFRAASKLTVSDVKAFGVNFGARYQAGDPKALTDFAVTVAPIKTPPIMKNIAKITTKTKNSLEKVIFSAEELKKIENRIKTLQSKKGKTRIDTQELKLLKEQKKIYTELKFQTTTLDNIVVDTSKKIIKGDIKKTTAKKVETKIKTAEKKATNLIKKQKDKAKELEKFEKQRKAEQVKEPKIKVKPKTDLQKVRDGVSDAQTIKILKDNIKDGKSFKKIRQAVEKQTGKKVLIREKTKEGFKIQKGEIKPSKLKDIQIKLVSKKEVQQLTKAEKGKPRRIDVKNKIEIKADKKELREIKKQSAQIELDLAQGRIEQVAKRVESKQGLFKDKRGSVQINKAISKGGAKFRKVTKATTQKLKKGVTDLNKSIRSLDDFYKKQRKKKTTTKKDIEISKKKTKKIKKQKEAIKRETIKLKKKLILLRKSLTKALRFSAASALAIKQMVAFLEEEVKVLENVIDQTDQFKIPKDTITPQKTPYKPPKKLKTPPKTTPKKKKTPPKKTPRIPRIPKGQKIQPPREPRTPPKVPTQPPERPVKVPRFADPIPRGTRVAVNIRIANKVYAVRAPINKAMKRATTIVLRDPKLKRFDLVAVGLTKQTDIKRPKAITKFKGTRGNKVYTFIQK